VKRKLSRSAELIYLEESLRISTESIVVGLSLDYLQAYYTNISNHVDHPVQTLSWSNSVSLVLSMPLCGLFARS
jgi:hypothetical protein